MLNKKIILGLVVLGVFLLGSEALAELPVTWPQVTWPPSPLGTTLQEDSLPVLIQYLYEWALGIGGAALFIILIVAGIQYLTSAGDPGRTREAKDRIKSAVFGLVLLFSAVLILNTINPQLTTLKPPPPAPSGAIATFDFFLPPETPCQYATLYDAKDFGGKSAQLNVGEAKKLSELEQSLIDQGVNSIKLKGQCELLLYYSEDFTSNDESPVISIFGDVKKIKASFNMQSSFKSARLSAIETGSSLVCGGPACLYEHDNFNEKKDGLMLTVGTTQSLDGQDINDKVTSVRVNEGYALVLFEHSDFSGRCRELIQTEVVRELKKPDDLGFDRKLANDSASAVILLKVPFDDKSIPEGAIKVCGNANCEGGKEGWQVNVTEDIPEFKPNDQASAIQIQPGYAAILYGDTWYRTFEQPECRVVTKTINDFKDPPAGFKSFHNRLSSIQVYKIEEKVGQDVVWPF